VVAKPALMPVVRPQTRASAAFSLIELMVVVAIIGVMAAAIAPGLSLLVADNRQSGSAMDLVRFSRRARALSLSTGVAHLMRFQEARSGNLGRIELFAGMTSKCQQTPWAVAFAAAAGSPLAAVDVYDMAFYNRSGAAAPTDLDANRQVILLRAALSPPAAAPIPQANAQICYQPNGETYFLASANAADAGTPLGRQALPLMFTISRTYNAAPQGIARQIMFPVGGNARMR